MGEFAFVVLAAAKLSGALPEAQANLLTLIAALSMVSTPLLLMLFDRWCRQDAGQRAADAIDTEDSPVIVAGFGRYGQTVARLLLASDIHPTVIDLDADTVDSARRYGFKVHFGDASQPELLYAAGIAHAKAMVVAIDDAEQCTHLVKALQLTFPNVQIVARARDARHAMALDELNVPHVEREVFESSLRSGRAALELLGMDRSQAKVMADNFRRSSPDFIRQAQADRHNQADMIMRLRESREQFEREMQADQERQARHGGKAGWHGPPRVVAGFCRICAAMLQGRHGGVHRWFLLPRSTGCMANKPRMGPAASQGKSCAKGTVGSCDTNHMMLTMEIAKPRLLTKVNTLPIP